MRVLVTGGAGLIGSHFARHLLHTYDAYTVIVFDRLTYAGISSRLDDLRADFPDRFFFVQEDICDSTAVEETLKRFDVEAIVNFAAESHVDRSLAGPTLFVHTNVLGTSIVLENAIRCGIRKMVHVSTDEVYGEVPFGSVSEQSPLTPRNPYAASKAGADEMVTAYHATFGLNVSITRSSNNYGTWQHPEKFIAKSIIRCLQGEPIQLHADGRHVRDWIWVLDNCQAIDIALHKGVGGEVYNIGARELYTNLTVAELILRHLGLDTTMVEHIPDRQVNDRRYSMNSSKISSLGWKPFVGLEEGLTDTIEWYKSMRPWWGPIVVPTGQSGVQLVDSALRHE